MTQLSEKLQADVRGFKDRILAESTGVLDPEGVIHHEFVKGNHGRKLDFDNIQTDSNLYVDWISIFGRVIKERYNHELPDALVGIANGANRLSRDVSLRLGGSVIGLLTVKVDSKTVRLNSEALEAVEANDIQSVLVIDDVGTTGSTTASAVEHLRKVGVKHIEAITTWQRNSHLPFLDALGVPYTSLISEPLPMYSPLACATDPEGFCAQGVPLVPHNQ